MDFHFFKELLQNSLKLNKEGTEFMRNSTEIYEELQLYCNNIERKIQGVKNVTLDVNDFDLKLTNSTKTAFLVAHKIYPNFYTSQVECDALIFFHGWVGRPFFQGFRRLTKDRGLFAYFEEQENLFSRQRRENQEKVFTLTLPLTDEPIIRIMPNVVPK